MKKLTLVVLFIGCMLALARTASAQWVPYDSLYGANREGIYFREDVVDLVSKTLVQTIMIGSSASNWLLKEAKLYGNPDNPNAPGYYVLRFKKPLKVGRTITVWAQIDKDTWLPGAAKDFDVFKDEDVVMNDQGTGQNLKIKVTDYISFNFPD